MIATSLALALNREAELGISTGHGEAIAAVEDFLAQCEPERNLSSGAAHESGTTAPAKD
jgi:hypothetical protein